MLRNGKALVSKELMRLHSTSSSSYINTRISWNEVMRCFISRQPFTSIFKFRTGVRKGSSADKSRGQAHNDINLSTHSSVRFPQTFFCRPNASILACLSRKSLIRNPPPLWRPKPQQTHTASPRPSTTRAANRDGKLGATASICSPLVREVKEKGVIMS